MSCYSPRLGFSIYIYNDRFKVPGASRWLRMHVSPLPADKCSRPSCREELHEQKLAVLFSHICYDCAINPMNHAKCGNVSLCVAACLFVCVSSQRQPPARPSFACSRECASSSETPSPKRALWRSRPLKSYQVQNILSVTLILPHGGKVRLTRTESFLIRCFSRGTLLSISPPTGVL